MVLNVPGWRGRIEAEGGESPVEERIARGRRGPSRPMPSFRKFLEEEIKTDRGPFTFEGREALRQAVDHLGEILRLGLPGRTVSVLKGTQIGMTTVAVGLALYAVHVHLLNVGYFLPDQEFANRFGDTRIRPAIWNPRLSDAMRDGRYKGASSKGLKEFPGGDGSRFLYILGLRDIGNAISLPLDLLIRDEVDDLPPENLAWSNDRLDASKVALTFNLAMGRTPGGGIQAMYEDGDCSVWLVPCIACGGEWALEENWPDVFSGEGEPYLACPRCGARLARSAGRWSPRREAALEGHRSWRIPQLAVGAIHLGRIGAKWRAARRPSERAKFRCSVLALPDAGKSQPIDLALLALLRDAGGYSMEPIPS